MAAECTFIARSMDVMTEHVGQVVDKAALHKGTSFVEIIKTCNIFNDGTFKDIAEKNVRDDRVLFLEHGKPMIFGAQHNKGISA